MANLDVISLFWFFLSSSYMSPMREGVFAHTSEVTVYFLSGRSNC